MHMLLKPMPSAIRALVYDPLSEYLAVAYGNQVSIYSLGITGGLGIKYWDCVERIPPPPGKLGETSHGLVTCLAFFGTSHRRRRLFVGYARLGFLYVASCYILCATITCLNQCLDGARELYTYGPH